MTTLSRLYGRAAQLRRAWYERRPHRARRLARPVISVGNLVVGGSGKTPVVATLARLLLERGEHPAILSRGYGRRDPADGVVVVSDGRQVLERTPRSGDEPQMLARALPHVPVVVSSDRYLAGRLAERRFGCTVHLLDDGFQHLQLARDVNLLLMSRADLDEQLLPSGRLREPLEAARAADALLVAGTLDDAPAMAMTLGVDAVFCVSPRYGLLRLVEPFGAALPPMSGRKAVAVAGIARPERFFSALGAEGWDVVREMTFRDHHWFTPRDLESIRRAAAEAHADLIVTTEKDAMRLIQPVARTLLGAPKLRSGAGGSGSRGEPTGGVPTAPARWGAVARPTEYPPYGEPLMAYLPMDMVIGPGDRFAAWLGERLAAARAGRPQEAA